MVQPSIIGTMVVILVKMSLVCRKYHVVNCLLGGSSQDGRIRGVVNNQGDRKSLWDPFQTAELHGLVMELANNLLYMRLVQPP